LGSPSVRWTLRGTLALRDHVIGFDRTWVMGRAIPPEHRAQLVMFLASGRADVLSGRYLTVFDDIAPFVERNDEIVRDDLYTRRSHALP
jgi:hypothetical protein